MENQRYGLRAVAASGLVACMLLSQPFWTPVALAASDVGTVTTNVILREEKSTDSKALATLKADKKVDVLSSGGSWVKVRTGSLTGYIKSKYIELTDSGSSSSEEKEESSSSSSDALKRGDSGQDVKDMQKALIALGYLDTEATGNFGPATEEAVISYQEDAGLTSDGIAGRKTLEKLFKDLANGSSSSSGSSSGGSSSTQLSDSSLKKGDEGSQVKALQELLKAKGFFSGDCTGFFGSLTEDAVMSFQRSAGLTSDGVAGAQTISALKAATGNTSGSANTGETLKHGDSGDAVKLMQQALITLGYLETKATGSFGSATEEAVVAFQQAQGMTADGVVGKDTLTKLYAVLASGTGGSGSSGSQLNSSGSLKEGDEGDEVFKVQNALISKGYLNTSATGFFGSATASAVRQFQRDNNLTADGVVGKQTLNLLLSSSTSGSGSSDGSSGGSEEPSDPPLVIEPTQTNGSVVLEDWWSGLIDSTYKRGQVAQVRDLGTGITFNISRYGGHNHLDAEPLTPEDSEKYFQAFGYQQTWSARAIHVTINGVTYAAAMNGMPHGGQNITTNNFEGQFCIHFLNSRTHGGDSVNQDMQNQVMNAFRTSR